MTWLSREVYEGTGTNVECDVVEVMVDKPSVTVYHTHSTCSTGECNLRPPVVYCRSIPKNEARVILPAEE
jgi:hypothetical protein